MCICVCVCEFEPVYMRVFLFAQGYLYIRCVLTIIVENDTETVWKFSNSPSEIKKLGRKENG